MRRARLLPAFLLVVAACAREAPWATEPIQAIEGQVRAGKAVLVDVRPGADWAKGHLPGALTLPAATLLEPKRVKLGAVYFGRPAFVYGARGADAQKAVALLRGRGVDARPLKDGFSDLSLALGIRPGPVSSPSAGEGK